MTASIFYPHFLRINIFVKVSQKWEMFPFSDIINNYFEDGMMKAKLKYILLLNVIFFFVAPGAGETQNLEQATLRKTLEKIRQYCTRLKNGAYHFVCLEEISEKIDYTRDFPGLHDEPIIEENKYLYDYQLIRKGTLTKESRILLEWNGEERHEEDAQLETKVFRHKNVLIRTVDVFSGFGEAINNYRIIKEETLNGEEAIVIEAVPKSPDRRVYPSGIQPTYLHGKIWVKKDDFCILRIEWNPKIIKDFKYTEELAKKYRAEPCITIISEYRFEKKGIRFPSRLFVEEAYIGQNGNKFIRSETDIIYKDYKFFMVETEVKY